MSAASLLRMQSHTVNTLARNRVVVMSLFVVQPLMHSFQMTGQYSDVGMGYRP